MKKKEISMEQKFQLIRFMDNSRWKSNGDTINYDIPNYFDDKNQPDEQKILTHFLGYITDRQTPSKLIFEQIDFIFSQLVDDYVKGITPEDLLVKINDEKCYFGLNTSKKEENKYVFRERKEKHYTSAKYPNVLQVLSNNERLCAASRFYPTDYIAILCTLEVLNDNDLGFEKSIVAYIKRAISCANSQENELECMLYALWLLGYADARTWSTSPTKKNGQVNQCYILEGQSINKAIKDKKEMVRKFFASKFDLQHHKNLDCYDKYKIKRVTCFVRDLLKFNHFSKMFSRLVGAETLNRLNEQLHVLELPGDVWNNNSTFRRCFLKGSYRDNENDKKIAFNQIIRELHKKGDTWYPEQFDCTFDFVPRMCEKQNETNCIHCPMENAGKIPDAFCSTEDSKYCPFLLFACGYKTKCGDLKDCCPNRK